jgi:hypothetical protein
MFCARSAAMDAGYPRPGTSAGKNATTEAFTQYFAFKVHVACAAFLATGR